MKEKRKVCVDYTVTKEVELEVEIEGDEIFDLLPVYHLIKEKTGDDENVAINGVFDAKTDECYYED